jgi:magnesium-transporting ATPase (P-type)
MDKQTYKQKIQLFFKHPETRFILPSTLLYVGIMIFVGSLIMFGFGVAPVLFKVMPTKDLAGMANQAILSRMVILQGIALFIMAGSLILLRNWSGVIVRKSMWFTLLCIAIIYAIYGIFIQDAMLSMQNTIGSFDNPLESGKQALVQFRQLHKLYSFLSSFAALLSIALMILHMYINRITSKSLTPPYEHHSSEGNNPI